MAEILGTEGNDYLAGTTQADSISALGGDDYIEAGLGDSVDGGDGFDRLLLDLRGAASGLTLVNTPLGSSEGAVIFGATIRNVEQLQVLFLPDHTNIVTFYYPAPAPAPGVEVFGGSGVDIITANTGQDTLHGGNDGDSLSGGAGDDRLYGDAGNDFLVGGSGHNLIDGGSGLDVAGYFDSVHAVTIDLAAGTASNGVDIFDILTSVEVVYGSGFADTLRGSPLGDTFNGWDGDDLIEGLDGNDSLNGDAGADTLRGGAGNDTISSGDSYLDNRDAWLDSIEGGDGDDTIDFGIGDTVDGGAGADVGTLHLGGLGHGVSIRLADVVGGIAGGNGGGTVTGIETIRVVSGSGFADTVDLTGVPWVTVVAGAGDDVVLGSAGNDVIFAGSGTDRLYGGAGNDAYFLDSQDDLVFEDADGGWDYIYADTSFYLYANVEQVILTDLAGAGFAVGNALHNQINGNDNANLLLGGDGDDIVFGAGGNDVLYGEAGNDNLIGWDGVDYLVGGAGDDGLSGSKDADALYGEDGNDQLDGGNDFATDILVGGAGQDVIYANSGLGDYDILNGGADSDTYFVDTPDDIIYEAAGEGRDRVVADIVGAGYYLWANVEDCTLVGTTPFAAGNNLDNELEGSAAANWLLGNEGNDRLKGMGGNDVLFGDRPDGLAGNDVFIFGAGSGHDVIGDFHPGEDRIHLVGLVYSFEAIRTGFSQVGADGAIDLGGGNFIILQGVNMDTLTASDFSFG
ncbi:hemolysin type calcium-binding protein [Novosphingobium kunmingense]|uniref:Hemolysin type calcium-binding protein n=1 Tax=Novosphingobium kunmingense TaxID=1211806 RepID=A0A2N0I0X5_9SPHN|nr:calcium-binding protein [Novosphingobium kunmingense]PKB24838.1 hemolysin type calcium-binding protein [Novosphingobium kunmingense]